jgi:ABC-type antimicrobial peptide transport system permease subunit
MFKNYFKTAWRNLIKNKMHSLVNIIGLSIGMAVALLIGLWIYDELSFNKNFENYDNIAQVMHHDTFNNERETLVWNPYHFADLLRKNYAADFKYVIMSTYPSKHTLKYGEKLLSEEGNYMGNEVPYMLSLKMINGSKDGLKDPYSILLSKSIAKALFGDDDPINKIIRIDNVADVKVTGVYKDLPYNSDFKNLLFIAPWNLFLSIYPGIKADPNPWSNNNYLTYVQIADNADMDKLSGKIKDFKKDNLDETSAKLINPVVFLQPMSKWHLFSEFKNGKNVGGQIEFVWLFGIIGMFVLVIACINCMNINIAHSQKRAKEIGIRKTIGSERWQLIVQFFLESLFIVAFAFIISILLVQLALPFFNQVADKKISILWSNVWFWLCCLVFCLFTGLVAGLYPAVYLSSLRPLKVLKGTFKVAHLAILQRKALIVFQFTVSVILIICTIVVLRQIQFAKNRQIGYNPKNLITIANTPNIYNHFTSLRDELIKTGAAIDVVESSNPTTENYVTVGNLNWEGKDPNVSVNIAVNAVTSDYGKTIGWNIIKGRSFSKDLASDSSAFIINEAAVKFMGFKNPIGKTIEYNNKPFHVIGVIQDIVVESPYSQTVPYIYLMSGDAALVVTIKLNPAIGLSNAINEAKKVFTKFDSESPFDFKFVDQEFAKKFSDEERIGTIASFFAALTIFISCLGLLALSSLIIEQRRIEIGIRKVLGATVITLCKLLSKDFVALVAISFLIAAPVSYYFMHHWLENYSYRTTISWWIFATAGVSALLIAILVVNFQAVKAAITNPVKSLRTE